MELLDKNAVPFLDHGDIGYVNKFQKIDTSLNKLIDEMVAFQDGVALDLETEDVFTNLRDAVNAKVKYILTVAIQPGPGITCDYNEETGILTIGLAE